MTRQTATTNAPRPIHHGRESRGLDETARSSIETGKFGRMFRWLLPAVHTPQGLAALAPTLIQGEFAVRRAAGQKLDSPLTELEPEDENPTISAGYTYLGQFIDHDLTFDPASSLQKQNDPNALEDFRTARFDLDSVYGRGPDDQPYLYEKDGLHLLVGRDQSPPSVGKPRPDLLRNPLETAIIGDPRNDENEIVSQLHALFVRFHNKVINEASLAAIPSPGERFRRAQRLVRWHYQWIVLREYLPRIVGKTMADEVLGGLHPNLRFYKPRSGHAYMPVEFSVAAYRFGHSMVRPSYALSETVRSGSDPAFNRIPVFSDKTDIHANLNGFRPLPGAWGIDWRFFFDGLPPVADASLKLPQPSYRIDTKLVDPLANLPGPGVPGPGGVLIRSLAHRNLLRGLALKLPSGQDVAHALNETPLDDTAVWEGREEILAAHPEFIGNAPLWFYILREAEITKREGVNDEHGGHHLGRVGGRIVAEVFVGIAFSDHHSYLYQAAGWLPEAPITSMPGRFTMADLIAYVDA